MLSAKEFSMDVAVVTIWSKLTGVFAEQRTALKAFFPTPDWLLHEFSCKPQTIAVCHSSSVTSHTSRKFVLFLSLTTGSDNLISTLNLADVCIQTNVYRDAVLLFRHEVER